MAQVIAVCLDGAEGDAAEAVQFKHMGCAAGGGGDVDVRFFADADLVAEGIEVRAFDVRVEGKVVEAAVGKAVAVI